MKPVERPPSDLRARVLAAASRAPSTRPGTWSRRVLGVGAFALVWTMAAVALVRGRSDWGELPASSVALTFAVLLAVAGVALGAGLTRGRAMAGPPLERLAIVVAVGLTALLALVLAVDPGGPSTKQLSGGSVVAFGPLCGAGDGRGPSPGGGGPGSLRGPVAGPPRADGGVCGSGGRDTGARRRPFSLRPGGLGPRAPRTLAARGSPHAARRLVQSGARCRTPARENRPLERRKTVTRPSISP